MEMDLFAWFDEVTAVLRPPLPVPQGMAVLLEYCQGQFAWDGWARLQQMDFASELHAAELWLTGVFTGDPPPDSTRAFWFGIFNPVYAGRSTCDFYVAGAEEFDPEDDSFEWAVDPVYLPETAYAHSRMLAAINQVTSELESPANEMGSYVLCLGYTALVVSHLALKVDKRLWLGTSRRRGLAVGFDSGDGILLAGFRR